MTIFFTSDSHFGHERIITLSNRPFKDVNHMNEVMIRRWNEIVGPEDEVYHLGDVALGSFESSIACVGRLNGIKTLLVGNHDRLFIDPEVKNIEKAQRYVDRFREAYYEVFDHVVEGTQEHAAELLLPLTNGQVVRLSHFPYTGDSHDKPRYDLIRPQDDGRVLLHGHTHQHNVLSESAKGTKQIHVGVDSWDYAPVSEATLMLRYSDLPH